MNIREVIMQRKSVRTYQEEIVSKELRQKLENYIRDVDTPFDTKKIRFEIIDINNNKKDMKLGTYGVIKGAKTFICAVIEKGNGYEENLGYAFEKIILYATSLGLGTCWLGGTFKRADFGKTVGLQANEFIPVITPIGYPKANRSLLDTLMVMAAGSKNRKDWIELFFADDFDKPLKKEEVKKFEEALEMVRIAPSASNKQPWRIVKYKNTFHFFLCRNKGYGKALGFDIQRLDMGIAMCHFETMINELGYLGKWDACNPGITLPERYEYIVSFTIA
ncbi:MAG: nitroreductase [Firmicutes bacterium HGW-Firmicutes-12]|jgi:nitroreductase|nr:MAG: nitroreductase [Firmicutes bacterium HGW-Firmicutes-12]